MSKTPETDALVDSLNDDCDVEFATLTDHARKLELRLAEAREKLRKLEVENDHNWQANEMAEQAFRERDEAREQLKWKQHRVEVLQRVGSRLVKQRNELIDVMERNRPGMEKAQAMLDGGRWAGFTLIDGVTTELQEAWEQRDRLAEALEEIRNRLHELPDMVLANEKKNPAWSKAELLKIERDIILSVRALCRSASALLPENARAMAQGATESPEK